MLNTMRQRVAALPRETRDTLFLLVVIAWVIAPHAGRLPVWCSVLAAAILLWRGVLAWRQRPLPGRLWVLAVLAATVAATWFTHRSLLGRDSGVTLLVVLLTLKTLELRARRDAFVVFFLGFFVMLTHFFFSQSLLTAAAMLVGLLGLLTALVNVHLPVGRPPLSQSARIAGGMALLGAPAMALLFVLFPRFGPLWGLPSDALSGRSGLSAQMQVGTIASLALDDSVAFRVRFDGPVPPAHQLYFRGPVLSRFDGREWQPLLSRPGMLPPTGMAQLQPLGAPLRYEMTLEPHNRHWLLTLDATAEPPALGGERYMSGELTWVSSQAVVERLRYQASAHLDFRHGPARWSAVPELYRELPAGRNPRTLLLAVQLMRESTAPPEDKAVLVRAALQRLRTGGYTYTLEPGVYGDDTADEFWFDRKAGFCEHIASAFAVLMRAMDIPARVVTGYQGGERNPVDGFWTVRQSDAHAWTEVWLQGQGWVRVDPTGAVMPGRVGALQRLPAPRNVFTQAMVTLSPDLAARLRNGWEALNNRWNQWVLNYSQGRQLELLRGLGFASPTWEDLGYVLAGVMSLALLGGMAWTLWEQRTHDPWLRLLERTRARLARAGLPSAPSEPPRALALRVRERWGDAAAPLAEWLLRLEAQRYAGQPGLPLAALRREWRQLSWPA